MASIIDVLREASNLTVAVNDLKEQVSRMQDRIENHRERLATLEANLKSVKNEVVAESREAFVLSSMDVYGKVVERLVALENSFQSNLQLPDKKPPTSD